MVHKYKGYMIDKDGSREMPWNIYKDNYLNWIGCGKTLKECKVNIDQEEKYVKVEN